MIFAYLESGEVLPCHRDDDDGAQLMKNAYIKFLTTQDREEGFQQLSTTSQIIGLSDEIFCIPLATLRLLDDHNIKYTHASGDEVTHTKRRTWRFAHP